MTKRKIQGFWPKIDSMETAKAVARQGAWAALFVALFTAALTVVSMVAGNLPENLPQPDAWSFWGVGLFVAIGWGIYRMSRIAAVAGLVIYSLEQIMLRLDNPSLAASGWLVAGLFVLAFVHGVRGTFAYHALRRQQLRAEQAASGANQPEVLDRKS